MSNMMEGFFEELQLEEIEGFEFTDEQELEDAVSTAC